MANVTNSYGPPADTVVGYFDDYAAASAAVDRLARLDAPIDRLSIIGEGVQYVEDVVAKRTMARSLLDGALAGAIVGFLTGLFLAWLDWVDPSVDRGAPVVFGFLTGVVLGGLFGAIWHLLRLDGTRVSVARLRARRYRIEADDPRVAERASRQLGIHATHR